MAIYNDFDINTAATPAPWGAREEQVIKDIIDTLVGDTIDGAKATSGHLHGKLYNSSSVAMIDADSAAFVSVGTTIAMGANPINYDGTAAVGLLFNSSNEALLQNPVHINNSYNAFYSGNSEPVIYSSVDTGAAYPFLDAGHLVLQGRQTAGRDIVFVTGATPAERVRINSTGDSLFSGTITIQGLDGEGLILNRSGGGGYISYQDGAGAGQWLTFHSNTNNILYNYSASGVDGYFRIGSFTNNNQVSIETSTGNMAVGTSVPLSRFTVQDASPEISVVSSNSAGVSEINIYSQQGGTTYPVIGLLFDDTTNLADLRFNANGIRFVENASGVLTTQAVINGSGFLGLNNSSPTARFEMSESNDYAREILSCFSTTTTDDGVLQFQKSSSATIGTLAVTADDDSLGRLQAMGVSTLGVARVSAQIAFEQDAAASTTRVPGRIIFKTTDATNEVVERFRIGNTGIVESENQIRINEEGLLLNRSTGSGYVQFTNGSGTSQWSIQRNATGNELNLFNSSGGAGVFHVRASFGGASRFSVDSVSGKIGVNTETPDGFLHILSATAGTVTANPNADELTIEGSSVAGLSILTADAGNGYIYWGCPSDDNHCFIRGDYTNGRFTFGNSKATGDVRLHTNGTDRLVIDSTGYAYVVGDQLGIATSKTPASAAATGTTGSICWGVDTGTYYIYVCVATDTWQRVALATW